MNILLPTEPYQHAYGDLYGHYGQFFQKFELSHYDANDFYSLRVFDVHPWKSIRTFAPEVTEKLQSLSQYQCPYLEQTYHALLPRILITKNPERYATYFRHPMSVDTWRFISYDIYEYSIKDGLTSIDHCLLGTGYRLFALMTDGHHDYDDLVLTFDNGDALVFTSLIWFNK